MNPIRATINYVRESWSEIQKVQWPTKQTTIQYSMIVVVATIVVTTFFGLLDYGLQLGINEFFLGR